MKHRELEGKAVLFTVLTTVALLVGSLVELIPLVAIRSNTTSIDAVKPYTALEVLGRDIYVREGCYNCHSQMIRPFRHETARYGEYSKAGEFVYDHPFQWGSKRTGPDLHRVGGKYNDAWHYEHLVDPRKTSEGSIMPAYPWMAEAVLDFGLTQTRMSALAKVGVPYESTEIDAAPEAARKQAEAIAGRLAELGLQSQPDREIIALISYLQRLGTDIKGGAQ